MCVSYNKTLFELGQKHKNGGKIRVGFGVVFDGVFPMAPVFELMRKDDFFDPFIVVIPDSSRGWEHEQAQLKNTKEQLEKIWPDANIISPFSPDMQAYMHVFKLCDLWCTANPYDSMTRLPYRASEFAQNDIPTFFIGYGMPISQWYGTELTKKNGLFKNFWRVYAINPFEYARLSLIRPKGTYALSGYPKMDKLAECNPKHSERKKILIAPHHTIDTQKGNVNFGNFLRYADFFITLPSRFPEIDFIFRPHPLLFPTLSGRAIWSGTQCDKYLEKMKSFGNVEIQMGGPYLQSFADSDAIIHDCGSFTAEWLYTGKPGCYMIKDASYGEYNSFGKECLKAYEIALCEDDIIKFIENNVINGEDNKKEIRGIMREKVSINHPHASNKVISDLKKCILEKIDEI